MAAGFLRLPVAMETSLFKLHSIECRPVTAATGRAKAAGSSFSTSDDDERLRAIDDENGDTRTGSPVIYSGTRWNFGPNCSSCGIHFDPDLIFDETWHETTNDPISNPEWPKLPSVTVNFAGSAIWVFCIVPNNITPMKADVLTLANLTFILDGIQVQSFVHVPSGSEFLYSHRVFSTEGLHPGPHILTFEVQNASYVAFDYAIYTFENDTLPLEATVSPSSNISAPTSLPQSVMSQTTITTTWSSALATIASTTSVSPSRVSSTLASRTSSNTLPVVLGIAIGALLFCGIPIAFYIGRRRRRTVGKEPFIHSMNSDLGPISSRWNRAVNPQTQSLQGNVSGVVDESEPRMGTHPSRTKSSRLKLKPRVLGLSRGLREPNPETGRGAGQAALSEDGGRAARQPV
ncbi:hypothetical protein PUNSTDRAFT_130800 [Punctularia strigosozonata HHB-11173 SS5]|uniref:uncharacterized protein n=1 Tax=Punctularia strigosozonata (strain HHB-11173) TaxID=741275 RepID=UPI000441845E|nr:uncharacterized protein PUNSTDRAFT_130800 [Punctularia strigosozonata HHB-11173 SS5]EIN12542.1 hypothetical protein PUNSTDRAFT_130800 [Punctularia strigosozonata HHB-11173 SS5]